MTHPQETRINQNMDSQVKRTLQRAIEYEKQKRELEALKLENEKLQDQVRAMRNEAMIIFPTIRNLILALPQDAVGKLSAIAQLNCYKHTFNIK